MGRKEIKEGRKEGGRDGKEGRKRGKKKREERGREKLKEKKRKIKLLCMDWSLHGEEGHFSNLIGPFRQ